MPPKNKSAYLSSVKNKIELLKRKTKKKKSKAIRVDKKRKKIAILKKKRKSHMSQFRGPGEGKRLQGWSSRSHHDRKGWDKRPSEQPLTSDRKPAKTQ